MNDGMKDDMHDSISADPNLLPAVYSTNYTNADDLIEYEDPQVITTQPVP